MYFLYDIIFTSVLVNLYNEVLPDVGYEKSGGTNNPIT